jgi:hypothetical protein
VEKLMEKISYTASYTRISLYAQVSSSTAAKKAPGANASAADGAPVEDSKEKGGHCQRSKDGDTFTLSIEAHSIQISGTYLSDDSGGAGKSLEDLMKQRNGTGKSAGPDDAAARESHALDLAGLGAAEGMGADDDLSGGFVKALLDAMEKMAAKKGHRGHRHHFPQLGDSQDVADKLLAHLHQQHAEKGGPKADFADDVKKRLDAWKQSSQRVTMEYQEFRSEVRMKLTTGLDAWAAGSQDAAPASDSGSDAPPVSGISPVAGLEI